MSWFAKNTCGGHCWCTSTHKCWWFYQELDILPVRKILHAFLTTAYCETEIIAHKPRLPNIIVMTDYNLYPGARLIKLVLFSKWKGAFVRYVVAPKCKFWMEMEIHGNKIIFIAIFIDMKKPKYARILKFSRKAPKFLSYSKFVKEFRLAI